MSSDTAPIDFKASCIKYLNEEQKKYDINATLPKYTNVYNNYNQVIGSNVNPAYMNKKNILKSLSHMIPTYIDDSNIVKIASACTLPDYLQNVYNNASCTELGINDPINIMKNQKGCVLSFGNHNYFNTNHTLDTQISSTLGTMTSNLDLNLQNQIKSLLTDIALFQSESNVLNNEYNILSQQKTVKMNDSNNKVKLYDDTYNRIQTYDATINTYITNINNESKPIIDDNEKRKPQIMNRYYESNVDLLIRNCRELSYITLFEHPNYQGYSTKITRTFMENITRDNVFDWNKWAKNEHNSRYEIARIGDAGFNDNNASSIKVNPGMRAILFEHYNFEGEILDTAKDRNKQNDFTQNFPHIKNKSFDNVVSSIYLYGGFDSSVNIDEPSRFESKLYYNINTPNKIANKNYSDEINTGDIYVKPPPPPYISQYNVSGTFSDGGGDAFVASCPVGTWITEFTTRSGSWMDQISAKCSNGNTLGPYGGYGGGLNTPQVNTDGFTAVRGYSTNRNTNVRSLEFITSGTSLGNDANIVKCNSPNDRIVGIKGSRGTYLNKFGIICANP